MRVRLAARLALTLILAGAGPAYGQTEAPRGLNLDEKTCAGTPPPVASLTGASTYTYAQVGSRPLLVHVFSPKAGGARPGVLFFFGGGFRNGQATALARQATAFAARGYVAAIADYRVFCRDGVAPTAAVEDAEAAYAWLRRNASGLSLDGDRLVLAGGSAGGFLAASVAMQAPAAERPAALVLFNPVVDLRQVAGAFRLTAAEASAISPAALPTAALPPTIVLHGTDDKLVPISQVRDFCARATTAGRKCQLEAYENQGHSFYQMPTVDPRTGRSGLQDTLERSFTFLDKVLGRRTPGAGSHTGGD